jgi:hypothetical protein
MEFLKQCKVCFKCNCYHMAQEIWNHMKIKKSKTEDMKFIRGTEGQNKKTFRRNEIQTSVLESDIQRTVHLDVFL